MSRKGQPMINFEGYNYCRRVAAGVKFVKSRRGKTMIKIGAFTFCAKIASGPKVRWVCSTHNGKGCHAVVHTIDSEIVQIRNEHNH
ncbi:unnamed protein product, partial [Iphiclides podalirius]